MDKKYIARKISNCKKLIEAASSEDQKKIYQGYLDYWKTFDKSKKIPREIPPDPAKESEEVIVDIADQYADIFEIENAPKQAYYKRSGQWIRTKAFEEYLNKITK